MRFANSIATAILALATTAFAQTADFDPIFTPSSQEIIPAGSSFVVTWKAPATKYLGTINISLIGGATQNTQVPIMNIACKLSHRNLGIRNNRSISAHQITDKNATAGIDNAANSYTWAVDASLGSENVYGLVFKLESDPTVFQYSNPFQIKAGAVVTTTGYTAPTGSATTTLTNTGIKTITLSNTAVSTVPATSTIIYSTIPSNSTSSRPAYTHTSVSNHTTTAAVSTIQSTYTLITSTEVVVKPTATAPATVPTGTSAATRADAGYMTVVGLIMAALFL